MLVLFKGGIYEVAELDLSAAIYQPSLLTIGYYLILSAHISHFHDSHCSIWPNVTALLLLHIVPSYGSFRIR
jgi:hypothetical protein